MPEGPEVSIITKGLNKILNNKKIINFEFNNKSRYYNKNLTGYKEFINNIQTINNKNDKTDITDKTNKLLTSFKLNEINNKGKFIYWKFNNGSIIFQTLGMSGGWYINENIHSGIILTYLDGKKEKKLYYNDQRRFGTLKIINNSKQAIIELEKKLKTIGPDILNDKTFTKSKFITLMKTPKLQNKNISIVITNQKIISGIGNYLKAESLYKAKINPHRLVKSLSDTELSNLFDAMKNKIIASYLTNGASIRNYSDINNVKGEYQFEMEVYGRKKDKYNNEIITEKISGSTQNTYWCPTLQL